MLDEYCDLTSIISHILNKFRNTQNLVFSAEHVTLKLKIKLSGHIGETSSPTSGRTN